MGVADNYPSPLTIFTDCDQTLDDFTIFMHARMYFNGSPSYAPLISRGVTSDVWMGRKGADGEIGGGAFEGSPYGQFHAIAANTYGAFSLRRSVSTTTRISRYNGTELTNSSAPTTSSTGKKFVIGAEYPSGGSGAFCVISRLAIYNVCLTSDEIAALEAGFSPLKVRPTGLIEYRPFMNNINNYYGDKGNGSGTNVYNLVEIDPKLIGYL